MSQYTRFDVQRHASSSSDASGGQSPLGRTPHVGQASSTWNRSGDMSGFACSGGAPWRRMPTPDADEAGGVGPVGNASNGGSEADGGQAPRHGSDLGAVPGAEGQVVRDGRCRGRGVPSSVTHHRAPPLPIRPIAPRRVLAAERTDLSRLVADERGPRRGRRVGRPIPARKVSLRPVAEAGAPPSRPNSTDFVAWAVMTTGGRLVAPGPGDL